VPTLAEIARWTDGRLDGPDELRVEAVRPLDLAGPGDLTFVKDDRHLSRLAASRAGAVLCRVGDDVGGRPAVRVANPRLAAAVVIGRLESAPPAPAGRHPTAVVASDAEVPPSCHLGPFAVVEAGAQLGEHVVVEAHAVVGAGCRVGDRTHLHPGVVLYAGVTVGRRCTIHAGAVIGSAGFGYEMGPDGPMAFPQRGSVVLGDDVRIGANTTIDRATFEATRLGDGVKIDNLVQVGHNVTIGDGAVICALAGIGGGASLERRSILGPQGALAPDATLGEGTILGARGALQSHGHLHDPGRVYMGTPPIPVEDWRRWVVLRRRLKKGRRPFGG
jgi:UDP-3-O-[3-hydroxymyristoyl] glucosamine N-acyltransferase